MGYLVKSYQDTRQEEYRFQDDVGVAVWILLGRRPKYARVPFSASQTVQRDSSVRNLDWFLNR